MRVQMSLNSEHIIAVLVVIAVTASFGNQSCRGARTSQSRDVDAADSTTRHDESGHDGGGDHDHASKYHLESRPIAVVNFSEPIGKVSSTVAARIDEARDSDRRWDDGSYWAWNFIPAGRKPKSEFEQFQIRLPVEPYEEMEKRYRVNKQTVRNTPTDIGYTNGKEGEQNRTYLIELNPDFQSYIEIKRIEGTKITLKVHVNLWNVDKWKNEKTRDVIEIRETFTSPWYVDCSYLDGSGGQIVDNEKESEFCSQFKDAPWPHVHQ